MRQIITYTYEILAQQPDILIHQLGIHITVYTFGWLVGLSYKVAKLDIIFHLCVDGRFFKIWSRMFNLPLLRILHHVHSLIVSVHDCCISITCIAWLLQP